MAKRKELSQVGGRYRRVIGRFVNAAGKVDAKKFLLGTDEAKAVLANARLELLWANVCRAAEARGVEPLWDAESLAIAEAVRIGDSVYHFPMDAFCVLDTNYAARIADLRRRYPSVAIMPANAEHYEAGRARVEAHLQQLTVGMARHH